jgi:hypothetical protein
MVCLGNICINTLHKGAKDDDDNDDDDNDNNNNNNNNNNNKCTSATIYRLNDLAVRHSTSRYIPRVKANSFHHPEKNIWLFKYQAYDTAVISLAPRAGHEVVTSKHRRHSA